MCRVQFVLFTTKDTKVSENLNSNFVIFVLLSVIVCAACANFPVTGILEHGIDSRKGAKLAKFGGKR